MTPPKAAPTRLSLPEIGYLLHLAQAGEESLARHRLELVADPDPDVLRSGLSSLAAHGGVAVDRGIIRPAAESAVIAGVLATASKWVELGLTVGGHREVLHLVEGSDAVLMISRSPLGVLEFAGVRPGVTIDAAVLQTCAAVVGAPDFGALLVNAVGLEGERAIAAIQSADRIRVLRWSGEQPLEPGVIAATVAAVAPLGPGWTAMGAVGTADALGWAAMAVGAKVDAHE